MESSQERQVQKLDIRLSKCFSYKPEKLAKQLGLRGTGKEEGTRVFKDLLELLSELRRLSVANLPGKIQVKVIPAVDSAADVLEKADRFTFKAVEKKRVERCELLDRARTVQHEIQMSLICPDC